MKEEETKISTGVSGLDEILEGGFLTQQSYLIQGGPGTGKSTFGYHFLNEGLKSKEPSLFISFGERSDNILSNAKKLGLDLTGVHFLDLNPDINLIESFDSYSIFTSSEVESASIFDPIILAVQERKPKRVFLDSITMFHFLVQDSFQTRNLALSFIKFICNSGATLLMSSEISKNGNEKEATFWVDGIISLDFINDERKLSILKYRGSDFKVGNHSLKIKSDGVTVFPALRASEYKRTFLSDPVSSGIPELDKLLHGGIEQGTTTLITGPSGVGKTNLGVQFMKEAANRGERSAIYTFEESREVIIKRSEAINVPILKMVDKGYLKILSVEPTSLSADEFSKIVREDVETNGTKYVLIDSIGGYGMAVKEEKMLERLHSLTVYLQNMGVTTFLVSETQSITGTLKSTNLNASYLADNILFLRYLEIDGELNKAIGILKKRLSDFEKSIREFDITKKGIQVGDKISGFRGILSGIPIPNNVV